MRSMAPVTPNTAGIPIEWARIAACDVRVPSSLTSPTTCSRSSCTVSPGESSLATTTDGWLMLSHSSSEPRCMRCSITRSEEHTSELQSQSNLVCRLLLEKKKKTAPISDTQYIHHCSCSTTHAVT